ncbi:CAP domain-containing protein [Streptomyces xanthophaeus]|uniref:CAP domain-containing protein n=1 Tax=Streptomyces xanthophaeus TaxID=67385 RepID=UPI003863A91B|nr:CAP domain-containing protein [Streptomyces xanthophaeus]WST60141.1 CAP domain-containing protein [Streptomyces xanthophaeus]
MGRHRLHAAPRRGGKRGTAVRSGLLGVSVAVALGAAAVTTGMVPVGGSFPYVGVSGTDTVAGTAAKAKASPTPGSTSPQGGLANLSGRTPEAPAPAASGRPSAKPSPSASPSASASAPAPASPSPSAPAAPSTAPAAPAPPSAKPPHKPVVPAPSKPAVPAPSVPAPVIPAPTTPAPKPTPTPAPTPDDGHSAEEVAVVTLVNQARAQAGCGPVRANPPLAALAGAFSKDMATRGFFDHTDPDGNSPWDRAAKAGLSGLAAENIARGQGDAASVMTAWMDSPGHKANILNCEFRTLGVGVHVAAGGPWWTQEFGF